MKHSIELTEEQRSQLEEVIMNGKTSARKIQHAHIVLKSDSGRSGPQWSDKRIQEAFGVRVATIWRVCRRFLEQGLDAALNRQKQPERPEKRKVSGRQEAQLITLVCTEVPAGHRRWTIRLLRKKVVDLERIEEVGRETIRLVLQRNALKPWLKKRYCIPGEGNEEFVYHMEDVLDVYHRPYDPRFPHICMDEARKQLLDDKRESLPMEPGRLKCEEYEYERKGTYNIFAACEPLTGKFF